MPYAIDNMISTSPLEGGIHVTNEQYTALLEGMCSGLLVKIENGEAVLVPQPVGEGDAEAP